MLRTHRIIPLGDVIEVFRCALPASKLAVLVVKFPNELLSLDGRDTEGRAHDKVHLPEKPFLLRPESRQVRIRKFRGLRSLSH